MKHRSHLTKSEIDPSELLKLVRDSSAGGIAIFVGTVRDLNEGKAVAGLTYETYRKMAERKMQEIEKGAASKFHVNRVASVHRYGSLKVGDVSVAVAVSCEHRADAFDACRYVIDEIKRLVPLWKKEALVDGKERWVGGEWREPSGMPTSRRSPGGDGPPPGSLGRETRQSRQRPSSRRPH